MLWTDVKTNLEKLQIKNYLQITDYKKSILEGKIIDIKTEEEKDSIITESNNESEILQKDISYLFKKPWIKLSNIHKIVKIREYIKGLNYNSSVKTKIEKKLMTALKEKKLKKEDFVYDESLGKILSIHNLEK